MEKQVGPYPISKIISPNAVELKLPASFRIDAPINISCLWPYKPPTIPGQQTTPQPPIDVEGEPEYIVGEILDSRLRCNKLEFLVKWEGYTDENNSWEPEANCRNAPRAIRDFYNKYPNAPQRIARMQYENWNLGHTRIWWSLIITSYLAWKSRTKRGVMLGNMPTTYYIFSLILLIYSSL